MTASTLVEDGDSEKEPLSAYQHDNLVLRISRCFFEEKDTDSVGCLDLGLFRWLSRRQSGGYIKI